MKAALAMRDNNGTAVKITHNTAVPRSCARHARVCEKCIGSIDMHADTRQRMVDEHQDINQRLLDRQLDAVRMQEGGLGAQFFSIWVEPQLYGGGGQSAIRRADDQIAAVREMVEKHSDAWQ